MWTINNVDMQLAYLVMCTRNKLNMLFFSPPCQFLPPTAVQREVDQSVEMLKTKNTELQSVLDYLRSQPDTVDVDETVDATTPLYRQYVHVHSCSTRLP